jgi:hypothetical protein
MKTTWKVSHAPYGETSLHTATTIRDLGHQLAEVMLPKDWNTVAQLFGRRPGAAFEIPAREAGRIADVLHLAGCSVLLPAPSADLTERLAAAADRAAKDREPWSWS